MKRKLSWILAGLCVSAVVCASFRSIPEDKFRDPNRLAKSLGVSPAELKKVRHAAEQFSSDYRHRREPSQADFDYLMEVVGKGGNLASEVYWRLLPIKGSSYDKRLVQAAKKSAQSKNESEAFSSINLLHYFGDPHWTQLALAHRDDKSELMQDLVKEARE